MGTTEREVEKGLSKISQLDSPLQIHTPRLIAVLPFENTTENVGTAEEQEEATLARTTFSNHFSSRGYKLQWTGMTDELLKEKGHETTHDIVQLPLKQLGHITNADAIIFGTLTHFDRLFLGMYAQVAVGAQMKMVEVATGKVLWEMEDVSRGHTGGLAINPIGAALTIATNALAMRQIELLTETETLFRKMVKTIPYATLNQSVNKPTITLFVNNAANRILGSGETIRIGMMGDPNNRATFNLGEYRAELDMKESEPGIYVGTYEIQPEDNADNLVVRGFLEDANGLMTEWVDALGPVGIDTRAPDSLEKIYATGRDHHVSITWESSNAQDIMGYRIYRSGSPITGYESIAETEFLTYLDHNLENKQTYYYKVVAYDKAGNESPFSKEIHATPVVPGPTFVSGQLSMNQTWYVGASPYILEDHVIVTQGTTLIIEPGTEVRSRGGSLRIHGQLIAKGQNDKMILFTVDPSHPDGWWPGMIFDQTGERESILEHVSVTKAITGITCLASSPTLSHSDIIQNGIGLIIRAPSAHPIIQHNTIMLNVDDGVQIEEGAQPRVEGNRILKNGKYGIQVRNTPGFVLAGNDLVGNEKLQLFSHGGTSLVDGSGNWWGTDDPSKVLSMIEGSVTIQSILTGKIPDGVPMPMTILDSPLEGTIDQSAFMTVVNSPYLITNPVTIQAGVVLTIQAGVTIEFENGHNSLIVRGGTLRALGTRTNPILFTSASHSPNPGDYEAAVKFEQEGTEQSLLQFVGMLYAKIAIIVSNGSPNIHHAFIANNLQSGVKCTSNSAPKITYSTIRDHTNNAAILCTGTARPLFYRNHVVANAWGIINHSSLPLDARENWWGSPSPPEDLFLGVVEYTPNLKKPDPDVFELTPLQKKQIQISPPLS